ncbi:acetylesterase [Staphylococcus aureus]|nr:acetylesterase [Staphylococcus aureus]QOJ76315.1 esterase family protein [Staphylococcus aureus]
MLEFKAGKINKHVLYSDILNRDVTLSIYLPESYNQLVKYNVILCFDGLDFLRFGRIQRTYESLIKEARIDDAIIVGFHYEDVDKRREEFHPQGSRSHLTIQSVGKEILPFIDSTFSTLKAGNVRLLVGDSLDEKVLDKLNQCANKEQLTIWHVIGLDEKDFTLPTNGKRADFLTPNRELAEQIKKYNITYYYDEFEGGHQWKDWKLLLSDMLLYFLSKNTDDQLYE